MGCSEQTFSPFPAAAQASDDGLLDGDDVHDQALRLERQHLIEGLLGLLYRRGQDHYIGLRDRSLEVVLVREVGAGDDVVDDDPMPLRIEEAT
jgi:hypothetical protein